MSTLKPCPFCGMRIDFNDEDTLYPTGFWWRDDLVDGIRTYHNMREAMDGTWSEEQMKQKCYGIHCVTHYGGCGAEMHGDSIEEVMKKWNNRV